jgi:hypothetical protein
MVTRNLARREANTTPLAQNPKPPLSLTFVVGRHFTRLITFLEPTILYKVFSHDRYSPNG